MSGGRGSEGGKEGVEGKRDVGTGGEWRKERRNRGRKEEEGRKWKHGG